MSKQLKAAIRAVSDETILTKYEKILTIMQYANVNRSVAQQLYVEAVKRA